MPKIIYDFKYGQFGETKAIIAREKGLALQANNYTNKGTAFSLEERVALDLDGALPPTPRTLAKQVANSAEKVAGKADDIERFIYIRALFDRNVTLAHAVIASDIPRFLSIIYTPTVGLACQQYSSMFRRANGIHFYPGNIDKAEEVLRTYEDRDIRVAVVTDNQGILGIGDQGAGGIAICLGKLMLYTQGAGIAPWHCLPISLDVGTDNKELLGNPTYLGWHHERLTGDEYLEFVRKFARAFKAVFPKALCQWEDFSKQNAFTIRDAYLEDLISFNDDIQGTGSIALAGILAAMKIKKEKIEDQVFLINGAGAGGVGIAEQIATELMESGLAHDEALARIFAVDSRGVVTKDRNRDSYKEKFAKDLKELTWLKKAEDNTLLNAVINEKVTVLVGTSGQPGSFTKEIVEAMCKNSDRPVILPLSNPNTKVEALPVDVDRWSQGRALMATGSPFPPIEKKEGVFRIGQINNAFVFFLVLPFGIALGICIVFFAVNSLFVCIYAIADGWHTGRTCQFLCLYLIA